LIDIVFMSILLGTEFTRFSLEAASIEQGLRERARIHVLELAAEGHAARDPAYLDAALAQHLGDVVRGRLPFVGEVGGEDDLLDLPPGGARQQPVEADVARPYTVERRKAPHQ